MNEQVGIMVQRSNTGTYEIPGASEPEDWHAVKTEANEVEELGYLVGWEPWTHVYRVVQDGMDLYYFVKEE